MAINIHLFQNIIDVLLPFKTMFGRVIVATAKSTWWTILVCLVLIIMTIILMILVISIASIIRPTMTTAVVVASALAMASASRLFVAITLREISTWIMIKSSITLVIIALIAMILILALVCALVSLTSATEILASKGMSYIWTSIGSATSELTSIIFCYGISC